MWSTFGVARQDLVERRHEIVGDGAADAAIGEFDDVFLRTSVDAAAFQDFAVDADVAELVDDDGEPLALARSRADVRISVVLPAPRKPVTTVQGTRVMEAVMICP